MDAHEVTVDDYRACSTGGECEQAHRDSWWPQHQATAPKKWTRATQSLSELCNESYQDRGRHPINCVSWAQARRFCEARSARLPSEIEWEFAARGSEGRLYPWGDEPPSSEHVSACGTECVSWRRRHQLASDEPLYPADDGFPGTAPVGSFPAGSTSLGVFDLAGNVSEWTADVYRPYPGRVLDAGDHEQRVVRGGAFDSARRELLSPALRMGHMEDAHPDGVGFRCAADPGG
jgi:formylglycine-generating enzyme required for sulfatase activity